MGSIYHLVESVFGSLNQVPSTVSMQIKPSCLIFLCAALLVTMIRGPFCRNSLGEGYYIVKLFSNQINIFNKNTANLNTAAEEYIFVQLLVPTREVQCFLSSVQITLAFRG